MGRRTQPALQANKISVFFNRDSFFPRMTPLFVRYFLSVFLIWLCLPGLDAQEPGRLTQAFERKQAFYQGRLEAVAMSMRQLYLFHLKTHRQQASESGDYERAQAFQKEADRVREKLGPAADTPLTLILFPEEAELSDGLFVESGSIRALSGGNKDATATWKLPKIPHGGYEVQVKHHGNTRSISVTLAEPLYHVSGELFSKKSESTLGNLRIIHDAPKLTLTLAKGTLNFDWEIYQISLVSHAP